MGNIVMIHGAWHGGWCWQPVADRLRARGHRTYAPSLTGLGDRSHLLSEEVGLATHIADVVNLIRWEGLRDVVLVGHSYGGQVISCAAAQAADRIGALVYVDAFVTEPGRSIAQYGRSPSAGDIEKVAREQGNCWRAPPPDASIWVSDPKLIDWINARTTDQPLKSTTEPAMMGDATGIPQVPSTYVLAEQHDNPAFPRFFARYSGAPGWRTVSLDTTHDVMLTMPDELAELIDQAASEVVTELEDT